MPTGRRALVPQSDGRLSGPSTLALPFSTPRLQGRFGPGWSIEDVAVWGAGRVASIRLFPEPPVSSAEALPNRLVLSGPDSQFAAEALPDAPCIVLDIQLDVQSVRVSIRPATTAVWRYEDETALVVLPSAVLIAWARGARQATRGLEVPGSSRIVLALGSNEVEARAALAKVRQSRHALKAAEDYRTWCGTRLETADPVLGSLMTHTVHAAVSSRKQDAAGAFAGLAAGSGYDHPARTYYRDGYWTSQALLAFKPEWVREQIVFLAGGVHGDGEAPSAVIVPDAIQSWSRMRKQDRVQYRDHHSDREWWSDHFDSPLFLVILAADYVALTDDGSLLKAVESTLEAIGRRYLLAAEKGGGLPVKPRNDRDWADNVYRSGFVSYDAMLYLGAVRSLAQLTHDADLKKRCLDAFKVGQQLLDKVLWLPELGHYADFRTLDGFVEPHLPIDSFVGAWLDVIPAERERHMVDAAERLLITKRNSSQPYGDWGVMACFPPYRRASDLRGKSRFAYRYHNGSDWPYWDAVVAHSMLKLRPDSSDWHYPLMRWWSYGLEQGWPEPVEYYSPPYGRGSALQAWSGLASAVIASSFGWYRNGHHAFRPTTLPATAIRIEVEALTEGGAAQLRFRRATGTDSRA